MCLSASYVCLVPEETRREPQSPSELEVKIVVSSHVGAGKIEFYSRGWCGNFICVHVCVHTCVCARVSVHVCVCARLCVPAFVCVFVCRKLFYFVMAILCACFTVHHAYESRREHWLPCSWNDLVSSKTGSHPWHHLHFEE